MGSLEYSAKDEEWGKKLPGKWNSQGSHHTVGHQASLSDGLWLGLSIRVQYGVAWDAAQDSTSQPSWDYRSDFVLRQKMSDFSMW